MSGRCGRRGSGCLYGLLSFGCVVQFGFEAGDGAVERIGFLRHIGIGNRRIEAFELGQKRIARPLINRAAHFRCRIRQAGDGLGKQRIIFSHKRFRAFRERGVNRQQGRFAKTPNGFNSLSETHRPLS